LVLVSESERKKNYFFALLNRKVNLKE